MPATQKTLKLTMTQHNSAGQSKLIPTELADVLISSRDTLSDAISFTGTRVPVQALLDTLSCGGSVDDFLQGFPNVVRHQAEAVVKLEKLISLSSR